LAHAVPIPSREDSDRSTGTIPGDIAVRLTVDTIA
jgi:hypothetical protein